MIITINGHPGSGKTTIARRIADALGYKHFYMGKIRREAAKKRGMTLAEYNTFGETNPITDNEVDELVKELGIKQDNFVIESRTGWYLIPQSIKIFITVDPLVGAERVFKELQTTNHRNEDKELKNVAEVLASHKKRMNSDQLRYYKYYGIDYAAPKNFDFIIDTSKLTPEEVFDKTMSFIKQKMKNP